MIYQLMELSFFIHTCSKLPHICYGLCFLHTCCMVPAREECITIHVVCMISVVEIDKEFVGKGYGLLDNGFRWFDI